MIVIEIKLCADFIKTRDFFNTNCRTFISPTVSYDGSGNEQKIILVLFVTGKERRT